MGVVGLGHIAQAAILPAFQHAANCELAALVSDDEEKRKKLGRRYRVQNLYSYEEYDALLSSGEIDAVFIALPNSLHRDYSVRAARAGVHVLCEKPMAVTAADCQAMIRAAQENDTRLMIAYRLHFEEANMKAVDIVRSGRIGEPRLFSAIFSQQVREGDIRLQQDLGGGPLYDIGIYCINAARYLFRAEPFEVFAMAASSHEERFDEVDEMVSGILRFPEERVAQFTCSFGAADTGGYRIVGTKGDLRVDPAFDYARELQHELTVNGKSRRTVFSRRDQFAPEMIYFASCILEGKEPEPSGLEGLVDIRIIEALRRSIASGKPVRLDAGEKRKRPTSEQEIRRPPVREPKLVRTSAPKR
jgi:predicted dehydrogenase